MPIKIKFHKDELIMSSGRGYSGRYIVNEDGGLGPEEAERLSHDLLMAVDELLTPGGAPELLQPETARARGKKLSDAEVGVPSVEPTKPALTDKSGEWEDVPDAQEAAEAREANAFPLEDQVAQERQENEGMDRSERSADTSTSDTPGESQPSPSAKDKGKASTAGSSSKAANKK